MADMAFVFDQPELKFMPRAFAYMIALILLILPVAACSQEGQVVLITEDGQHKFNVELVDTPKTRAQGLMFRQNLGDNEGMLFDFKEQRPVAFWMRNTFIPLDMIFVRADGIIANIHVNALPQDPTSIPSDGPVQFVLEIPGGRSVEIGLAAGDEMQHPRVGQSSEN